MYDVYLEDELVAMNDFFVDDESKEVFMRRYIEVYKDCELVKEDEDLQGSRLTW